MPEQASGERRPGQVKGAVGIVEGFMVALDGRVDVGDSAVLEEGEQFLFAS